MDSEDVYNEQDFNPKANRRRFKSWKSLGFLGRVWRVLWITLLSIWAFTIVQVLFGSFITPAITPLMVQRFFQQVKDKDRKVNFERDIVSINDISPNLVTAVVYAEDGLFMYHNGFDIKQMKMAFRENQRGRRFRGGSTISQQTAKNAFLPHSRTMVRKAVEAYYTVLIEALWSKKRILEVYLNIVEFGDGIYGCEAASQHYFGHSADKLTTTEASQLAATLPSPLKRNPSHQTPFFKRQVSAIKQRFSWGRVNLDMPKDKIKEKKLEQESLIEFYFWMKEQKKEANGGRK